MQRPDGRQHHFVYDELGRLVGDEQPGGRVARLSRAATDTDVETRRLTHRVTYTSPGGRATEHETEFGHSTSSVRRELTYPDGTYTMTEAMPLRAVKSADGLEGSYVRETVHMDADGTVSRLFETIGNGAGFSDPVPARTTITTPGARVVHVEGSRARVHDEVTGDVLSETRTSVVRGGSASRLVTSEYDAATRTFTTTLQSGLASWTVLDTADRPIASHAPGLAPVEMGYDARGRLLWTRQQSSVGYGTREVSFTYDDPVQGELWTPATVTHGDAARTTLSHDARRRVTTGVTLPLSCTVAADCDDGIACTGTEICVAGECVAGTSTCDLFTWDTSDRLTAVRPLARDPHGLGYDEADRGISYTPPSISGQPSGEVVVTRDADGLVTRVDFDAEVPRAIVTHRLPDGRASSVQHDGHTVTYSYDPTTAELASLTTNDGIAVTDEQDGPLLESVTWSGSAGVSGTVAFTYGDLWDIAAVTTGGVAANYHYDIDGGLDCVAVDATADATCASGLRVIPNFPGRQLTMEMAGTGGVTSSYEWSDLGEATNTIHQWSGGELSFAYEARDSTGRLTRVVEDDGASEIELEYAYDVEGRLTEVRRDGVVTESYTYDPNGQRLTASVGGVPVAPITWDARDRLTQYGGVTYGYDDLGRRTSRTDAGQTTTYTYDLLGALRAVDLPGAAPDIEYLIDGAGRRVGRKVGGVLERTWLYLDDLRPIVEKNGSGEVTRVFVYGAGRVPNLLIIPTGQPDDGTYRIVTDHLGSVRRIVDVETGDIVQGLDYDTFGNVVSDTNPGFQPFGFAGGVYDPATHLVRYGARDYDPEIGQWTAKDPALFDGGDGNLYAYTGGDPINNIDETGHHPAVVVGGGVVVCAAVCMAVVLVGSAAAIGWLISQAIDRVLADDIMTFARKS